MLAVKVFEKQVVLVSHSLQIIFARMFLRYTLMILFEKWMEQFFFQMKWRNKSLHL